MTSEQKMNVEAPVEIIMRRMTAADNATVARVIRQVSAEYGLTADKGYTVADPNLDVLYTQYSKPGHAYWVVELDGEVVGGGGIAPLACSETDLCELQKMYFLPAARGRGLAKKLALQALAAKYGDTIDVFTDPQKGVGKEKEVCNMVQELWHNVLARVSPITPRAARFSSAGCASRFSTSCS